jgi:hypothetical protein
MFVPGVNGVSIINNAAILELPLAARNYLEDYTCAWRLSLAARVSASGLNAVGVSLLSDIERVPDEINRSALCIEGGAFLQMSGKVLPIVA